MKVVLAIYMFARKLSKKLEKGDQEISENGTFISSAQMGQIFEALLKFVGTWKKIQTFNVI